jgi:phosphate starvation-inducible PhoH-like protein
MARRKNKVIPKEELEEMEEHLNQNNKDEEILFHTVKINVKCKGENQKKLVNSIKQNEITICSGLPGTGKTYLACAEALKMLKNYQKYKRMVLIKSITPLKDEEVGHLPGDLKEKMAPIMESFTDNIRKLIGRSRMEKMMELGLIEIVPIAFARGRSIDNSIIIIDEAQNISKENIRTLMTRIGDSSKLIILGDVKQKDMRRKSDSSLEFIIEKFRNIKNFGCIELRDPKDVVRNPIIKTIEAVFEGDEIDENGNPIEE